MGSECAPTVQKLYRLIENGSAGVAGSRKFGGNMLKKTFAVILVTLAVGGCRSSESDKKVSQEAQTPAIEYSLGFFPQERAQDGSTWRWMGSEGVIRLKNTHSDMQLSIKGRVPEEVTQATIGVEFNGEALEPIVGAQGEVQRKYDIPAAKQGTDEWSRLRITTDQTFVPHEEDPKVADPRRLGFAVYDLSWEPK